MSELLVGCPISRREWILPRWADHVEVACRVAGVEPSYVFVGRQNDPTFEVVADLTDKRDVYVSYLSEPRRDDVREWTTDRQNHMADVRNSLLALVRELAPDLFLSLDSDVLLHPSALRNLLVTKTHSPFDAVGARLFMSEVKVKDGVVHSSYEWLPSYGLFNRENRMWRPGDTQGVIGVDIIMAAKLMGPRAYGVDYRYDPDGEDVGWSRNCRAAAVRLGWDGQVVSKHVMNPDMLDVADPRVGW